MTSTHFNPSSHDDVPLSEPCDTSYHAPRVRFPYVSGKNVLAEENARETLFSGFG